MRPGGVFRARWLLPVALILGLTAALSGGCSDDPSPRETADPAMGKTPVVRPEDVHGRGGGGSAVLAPDYRHDLAAGLGEGGQPSGQGPADPGSGRLFEDRTGASGSQAVAPSKAKAGPVAPSATPAVSASTPGTGFPVPGCRQLVVVVAPDFGARRGELRRWTRQGPDGPWREAGDRVPCMLGRTGLGVGRGLTSPMAGPVKRLGDGRTPAGLFSLPEAFGYADAAAAASAGVHLPYQSVDDRSACVIDPASPRFGRVVGPGERTAGGGRQERMKRSDQANVWGVVIGHNREHPDPEAGACLFVNVRPADGPPTGGSIGLPEAQVASLVAWLDPAANPLLAVLPEREYQAVRTAWGLP